MSHASLDLQHHLTPAVRAQRPSAMKAMGKLLKENKGIRSLAGGLPHREPIYLYLCLELQFEDCHGLVGMIM